MKKRDACKILQPVLQLLTLLIALVCSNPVFAADASSAQQAAQIALQQNGGSGKVLGVSTETDNSGRRVFAVKVLSNGRVRVVRIPQR